MNDYFNFSFQLSGVRRAAGSSSSQLHQLQVRHSPEFAHTALCILIHMFNINPLFSRWSCNCSGSKRKRSGKPLTGWQGDPLPLLLLLRSTSYPINLLELLISGSAKLSHPGNIKLKQQCEAGRDEHPHLLQLPLGRADRGGWDGGGNEGGRRGESHLHWRTSLGSSLDTVRRFPPILRLHADY